MLGYSGKGTRQGQASSAVDLQWDSESPLTPYESRPVPGLVLVLDEHMKPSHLGTSKAAFRMAAESGTYTRQGVGLLLHESTWGCQLLSVVRQSVRDKHRPLWQALCEKESFTLKKADHATRAAPARNTSASPVPSSVRPGNTAPQHPRGPAAAVCPELRGARCQTWPQAPRRRPSTACTCW